MQLCRRQGLVYSGEAAALALGRAMNETLFVDHARIASRRFVCNRAMSIRRVLCLAAALVGLVAALPAASAPNQGIRGLVTLGPTCPVQREGESCERPFAAVLYLRRIGSDGPPHVVRSGADGRFRVALKIGRYRLTPRNAAPYPHAEPQTVVVRAGRFTVVSVAYDTGIR